MYKSILDKIIFIFNLEKKLINILPIYYNILSYKYLFNSSILFSISIENYLLIIIV